MRRVRRHIRVGIEAGRDPAELTDEVIREHDLSSVEAAMAKTMAQQQSPGARNAPARERGRSQSEG